MIDEIIPFSVIRHNFGIEKKKLCEFLCSKNVAPGHIIQHKPPISEECLFSYLHAFYEQQHAVNT